MKKLFLVYTVLAFFTANLFAQRILNYKGEYKETKNQPYKIDASQFLEKSNKVVNEFLKDNPNYFNELKLQKKSGWNFEIGSKKDWWTYNIKSKGMEKLSSTCRGIGKNCYIFVEDDQWNKRVTQTNIEAIIKAFDKSTPANANKGIYQTDVETFGNPPDIDGDNKIIIFVNDIRDNYEPNSNLGYVGGYFHSLHEIEHEYSNKAEIYFLDCYPSELSTEKGLESVMATTAHEFQHMIHFRYHNSTLKNEQPTFFNESCSLVAEVICGYPIYTQYPFIQAYNHYLLDWRTGTSQVYTDYARAARYMTYMYEQFGIEFLTKFTQNKAAGIEGINSALSKLSTPTTLNFTTSLQNWMIANLINDKSIDPKYGYTEPNVTPVIPIFKSTINISEKDIYVDNLAAYYLFFNRGENLTLKLDTENPDNLKFQLIKLGSDNSIEIEAVNAGTEYNFKEFGTKYKTIGFAALNIDKNNKLKFSYSAKGIDKAIELAYDKSPPLGVLPLKAQDTICVYFNGVPKTQLDSIRVALRQAGTVKGGIYKYTGKQNPTPLGEKLTDIEVTSTIAEKPGFPYPEPWTNWVTLNLKEKNISAEKDFVVAFLVEGTYPEKNRVMVTAQKENTNASHSYSYSEKNGKKNWWVFTKDEDLTYAYLIRAYLSAGTPIEDPDENIVPSKFALKQNYPNPFNPTTTISYSIPKASFVTLKVYDMLGKEVATLVNKKENAGLHKVNFDGSNLSSGVYLYRLKTQNNIETKKLMLLK